ncbi:cytochrome C biogenesis protein [Allosaccharopolyspora coralli]|uniref:Cytochrome C biogenesis protein n=1 Tax=Allosaccharopolyspora coralli TaxID=2665642 RepID=A0A5Q3QAT1_9PSEU|nr:cytochrome c biogenesis protein CcdA [Allosaccharopolyspora coralli]QGK68719.1 cytochrome C biogenesis protein [Allosaccharopolyspora coralli]
MIALLAMAFGAGLISPVNPCGFALLPAMLGTVADPGRRPTASTSTIARLGAGVSSGLMITAGFAGTLTVAGLALSAGLRAITGLAPWFAVAVGILLAVAGLAMLTGWHLPLRLTNRIQPRRHGGRWGLFAFGIGYGIASLSCTVAVLLAVVSQALATTNPAGMLAVFAAYATGAATLLLLLSVSAAFASSLATRWVHRLLPHTHRITAVLLTLSGAYLLAYWIPVTTGGQPPTALSLGPVAGAAATWITTHQTLVVILALATLTAATIIATLGPRRRPAPAREHEPASQPIEDTQC